VSRQLDDGERFTLQNLEDVMSVRPVAAEDGDVPLFELVSRGVGQRRVLKFQYRKPGEKRAEPRRVHPYHLLKYDRAIFSQPAIEKLQVSLKSSVSKRKHKTEEKEGAKKATGTPRRRARHEKAAEVA